MSIAWITPAALLGLGLIALPIAIHLLVRQHARTLAYPSLRFLRETQLAAFRRRTIQDAALLACRIVIIALAALALAGPVLQTPSRTAGYASRTSRAIVTLEGADEARVSSIANGAFGSAIFNRSSTADALADAVRWLNQQPPSSREIVVAGTMRRGLVTESDLALIPNGIGVRFEHVARDSSQDVILPVLTRQNGRLMRVDRAVHLGADETRVTDGDATEVPGDLVSIVATAADQPLAEAALRSVLDAGVWWTDFDRPVVIVWAGADEAAIANRVSTGVRAIRMPVPAPPAAAADAVLAAMREALPRPDRFEPVMITQEQLTAWSRPPAGVPDGNSYRDEGDRRWVWGAVLLLLALEAWLRRSPPSPAAVSEGTEARVA